MRLSYSAALVSALALVLVMVVCYIVLVANKHVKNTRRGGHPQVRKIEERGRLHNGGLQHV